MVNFILMSLLIMPWVFIPNINITDQFRLPQALIMDGMFLGIIVMSFNNGNKFQYKNKYLSILLGWMFLTFLYYYFIPYSLEFKVGRILNTGALEPIMHIILGTFAVSIIISSLERADLVRVAKVICLSGALVAVFAILQRIGFDPLKSISKYHCDNRVSACLDNPNVVGNYLALSLPLFLMFSDLRYRVGAVIVFLGVLAANSHFAIALSTLSVVIFYMAKYRKSKIAWGVLGGIISLAITFIIFTDFAKTSTDLAGRLPVWKIGVEKLRDNVLLGQGIGVWKTWEVKSGSTIWYSCHNDWLERTIEMGVVWLALAIAFVVNSLRKVSLQDELSFSYLSMFVVFLVMMFGSFPFETPTIAVLGLMSFIGVERS